jgi:hypothetical protein
VRFSLLVPILLVFAASAALADGEARNGTDLRELLLAGHHSAKIERASHFSACIDPTLGLPALCSIDIDGLSILYERGVIQRAGGGQIRLIQHSPGDPNKELPAMDWNPVRGFKVFRADRRWGTCLEFNHSGIGKSGHYQRWQSVVLVPWKGSRPGSVAHRFTGYWLDCNFLAEGNKAGEIILPIIEPTAAGSSRLHVVWQRCTAEHCIKIEDSRSVSGDPWAGDPNLVIKGE